MTNTNTHDQAASEREKVHEAMSIESIAQDLSYWLGVYASKGWELVSVFPNPESGSSNVIAAFKRTKDTP